MEEELKLTNAELYCILDKVGDADKVLTTKIENYLNRYIPQKGIIEKKAFVLAKKWGSEENKPLEYKIEVNEVDSVKDYSKDLYECIRKRQYYHPKKEDVFAHRWQANLAGHKKHLDLLKKKLNSITAETSISRYNNRIKKVERNIYLIEEFPEKWI